MGKFVLLATRFLCVCLLIVRSDRCDFFKNVNACALIQYTPNDLETCDCLFDLFTRHTLEYRYFYHSISKWTMKCVWWKEREMHKRKSHQSSVNENKKGRELLGIKWCTDIFSAWITSFVVVTYTQNTNEWNCLHEKEILWLRNVFGLYHQCSDFPRFESSLAQICLESTKNNSS